MMMFYPFVWYPLTSYYKIDNNEIKFQFSENISPYLELNEESFNDIEDRRIIEVNPFYRFPNEFRELFSPAIYNSNKRNLIDKFLDINLHFLGNIDLYVGQNRKDLYVKEIVKCLRRGDMGLYVKENIGKFEKYEIHMIGDVLYEMYTYLNPIEAFKKIIKLIYPDSLLYDKLSSEKNMILYLNYVESENSEKLELLKKVFFPMGLNIDIFWEKHFGVIDYSVVMKIGEISIY